MPVILYSIDEVSKKYTDPVQYAMMREFISDFRARTKDIERLNILDDNKFHYSDGEICYYIEAGIGDLNLGNPITNFTQFNFPKSHRELILDAAMIKAFIADGILQLRNNVAFSDSGLQINMFDKSGGYQSWVANLYQTYIMNKNAFKLWVNAGRASIFIGMGSEFGYGTL